MKRTRLKLKNPFYVRPARLTKDGVFIASDAARCYLDNLKMSLLRTGAVPQESGFSKMTVTLMDFAKQLDSKAYIRLKKGVK